MADKFIILVQRRPDSADLDRSPLVTVGPFDSAREATDYASDRNNLWLGEDGEYHQYENWIVMPLIQIG